MPNAVLLDTSFFIRFLNEQDPLFQNADGYFKYYLEHNIPMVISTISIAEYCAGGSIDELPLRNLRVLPFNIDHAKKAGELARVGFQNKGKFKERILIPNDTKLFAQADVDNTIGQYLSSDVESYKLYRLLYSHSPLKFQFVDLSIPYTAIYGILL